MTLAVAPAHLDAIRATLRRIVPGRTVWAFGSRTTGRARPTSDLDLCILGETRLAPATIATLRDAFDSSSLPFAVDLVEWAALKPAMRSAIEADHVVLVGDHPS